MFGHQNNDQDDNQNQQQASAPNDQAVNQATPAPAEPFNPALPMSNGGSFGNPINPLPPITTEVKADAPSGDKPFGHQSTPIVSDDLMDIKQKALSQLSPLVGHLDQTPEEKFRTTMMMIQASDNQDLVKDAYAAAQEITDEKAKAQALLDIVNEINYFTQHHQN
jgi:hypothetical protein